MSEPEFWDTHPLTFHKICEAWQRHHKLKTEREERHLAELLAAIANGALIRKDKEHWQASHFLPSEPIDEEKQKQAAALRLQSFMENLMRNPVPDRRTAARDRK
jgi:hypothetical protein